MNLRLRLIVAFFLLSVVPLGAITLYMYTSNARAMRDAAGHEAQMLADELSERMQTVTAQLSQQVEKLMGLPASENAPAAQAVVRATSPVAADSLAATGTTASSAPATASATTTAKTASASQVTAAMVAAARAEPFGDMTMLLNNLEIRGQRGFGRGGGGRQGGPRGLTPLGGSARGNQGRGGGPSGSVPPSAVQPGSPTAAPGAPTPPSAPIPPDGSQTSRRGGDPSRGFPGDRGSGGAAGGGPRFGGDPNRSGAARDQSGPGGPGSVPGVGPSAPGGGEQGRGRGGDGRGGPGPEDANTDPTRIRIDLAQIRREMFDQLVPDQAAFNKMTPEERDRIFQEVNQRIAGVTQGIELLRKELATRVEAQAKETAAVVAAEQDAAAKAAAAERRAATKAPTPPVAPPAPAAPTAAAAPTSRHTTLSGSRLDVRVERNGELVGQANAEIDMANLLATVFRTTRRDRGEVPFAVAKDGKLYTPTDADKKQIEAVGGDLTRAGRPAGMTVVGDWIVVTTADPTGSGLTFGIARPIGDALRELQTSSARNAGLGLGLLALALIGMVPVSSRLTRHLSRLNEGVHRLAGGDYGARVEVGTNDEIGRLARAFNQMASDVEKHQRSAVEQERLRRELELGRQIQHDMLPQAPLRLGLTEVKGVSVPAREVGGDFFNYFETNTGQVALVVGDVSGKGVGAALLMMNIQASLRTRLALGQDLASIARELDQEIETNTPGPVYATLFVGVFDPPTRELLYVNAGHNPQYVLRRQGGLERMESTGLPIGLIAGYGYTQTTVQLSAGDLLFFYTDGCVEAENNGDEMFGVERLEQLLMSGPAASADEVLVRIESEIARFRSGRELFDDATMMVVNVG